MAEKDRGSGFGDREVDGGTFAAQVELRPPGRDRRPEWGTLVGGVGGHVVPFHGVAHGFDPQDDFAILEHSHRPRGF